MSKQRIINMLVCGIGISVVGGICYAVLADHPVPSEGIDTDDENDDSGITQDTNESDEMHCSNCSEASESCCQCSSKEEATQDTLNGVKASLDILTKKISEMDTTMKKAYAKIPKIPSVREILNHYRNQEQIQEQISASKKESESYSVIAECDAREITDYDQIEVTFEDHSVFGLFTDKKVSASTMPDKTDLYLYRVIAIPNLSTYHQNTQNDILVIVIDTPDAVHGESYRGTAIFSESLGIGETSDHSFGVVIRSEAITARDGLTLDSLISSSKLGQVLSESLKEHPINVSGPGEEELLIEDSGMDDNGMRTRVSFF